MIPPNRGVRMRRRHLTFNDSPERRRPPEGRERKNRNRRSKILETCQRKRALFAARALCGTFLSLAASDLHRNLAQKIHLAVVDAGMTQNSVSGRHVEVEIGQNKVA